MKKLELREFMNIRANISQSDIPEFIKSAQNHISWENYGEAIEEYTKALKALKSQVGPYAPDLKPIYSDMASVYEKMGETEEAVKYYKKVVKLLSTVMDEKPLDIATIYKQIGNIYYTNKEAKKAITYYKKSLEVISSEVGYENERAIEIVEMVAKAYSDAGDSEKAAQYYSQYYRYMVKVFKNDSQKKILCSLRLGDYYSEAKLYDEAFNFYNLAHLYCNKNKKNNAQQLALIYYLRANADYHLSNLKTAQKDYKKALSLQEDKNDITMDIYTKMGNISQAERKDDLALDWYKKALALYDTIEDKKLESLAYVYLGFGYLWAIQEKTLKAIEYYKKALDTLKKMPEPSKQKLMNGYYSIAHCYRDINEYTHAIEYYQRGLEVEKLLLSPYHQDLVQRYYKLGCFFYDSLENSNGAEKACRQALYIAELKNCDDYKLLANIYDVLADTYWTAVNFDQVNELKDLILTPFIQNGQQDSIQHFKQKLTQEDREKIGLALDAYKSAFQKYQSDYYISYDNVEVLFKACIRLGRGYSLLENYAESLKFYKKISSYIKYRNIIEKNTLLVGIIYSGLGNIFFQKGDYKKASLHFNKALAAIEESEQQVESGFIIDLMLIMATNDYHTGKHKNAIKRLEEAEKMSKKFKLNAELATIYNNLGVMHYANQDYKTAREFLEKSLKLKLQQNDITSPLLMTTYHNLSLVFQELSIKNKAETYHEKAYQIAKETLDEEDPIMQYLTSQTEPATGMHHDLEPNENRVRDEEKF